MFDLVQFRVEGDECKSDDYRTKMSALIITLNVNHLAKYIAYCRPVNSSNPLNLAFGEFSLSDLNAK